MPVLNANGRLNMGIGTLGFNNLVFKRKFRYTFEVINICGSTNVGTGIPAHFVKLAARPSLTIEETEINYLNGKTWIPGKASWETITVTYIDAAVTELQPLYNWLASVYNFSDPVGLSMGSQRQDYTAIGVIYTYDGCGTPLEEWVLQDMWPQAINWGELDMGDSELLTIELTLRYSDVQYQGLCPEFVPSSCCSPCNGNPTFTQSSPTQISTQGNLN
jgi:hypothetical protein